jgi:hypothetical protein
VKSRHGDVSNYQLLLREKSSIELNMTSAVLKKLEDEDSSSDPELARVSSASLAQEKRQKAEFKAAATVMNLDRQKLFDSVSVRTSCQSVGL